MNSHGAAVSKTRNAATLLELLVVILICSVICAIAAPAIQRARASARAAQCQGNLRQLGLALQQHHDGVGTLPPGVELPSRAGRFRYLSWLGRLLPYLGNEPLWDATLAAYAMTPGPFRNPPHKGLGTVLNVASCPADGRTYESHLVLQRDVGLTSYLGVSGTNADAKNGVLFADSGVRYSEVTDGLSNTVAAGERPPSCDLRYGWWYAGVGYDFRGTADLVLGAVESNRFGRLFAGCPVGPYALVPGRVEYYCDMFHYWSLHDGYCPFVYCDGSVRRLGYSAAKLLPALATRAGGEAAAPPD